MSEENKIVELNDEELEKVNGGNTNYNNLTSAELLALYGFNNKKEEVGSTQATGGFDTLNPEAPEAFYYVLTNAEEISTRKE